MSLLATIVDTEALLKTVAASFIAGVGITFTFALAILGAARFVDLRSEERPLAAGVFAVVGLIALAACGVAIAFGIVVMISD
jgi:hypothetical protein